MESKIFSAERALLKFKGASLDKEADGDISSQIQDIKHDIKSLVKYIKSTSDKDQTAIEEERLKTIRFELTKAEFEVQEYRLEIDVLKLELSEMSGAISQTKNEIAALSPTKNRNDNISDVSFELDEIVNSTETATQSILDSAEKIDATASHIQSLAGSNQVFIDISQDLSDAVMNIYESSNFQDLTGQRITKAINALKFIDGKINSMIMIWGEKEIAELALKVKKEKTADERLLNGPSSGEGSINQDAIDRLFS